MKVIEQIVRLTTDRDETKAEVVGEIVRCKDCEHHREKPIGFVNCMYHLTTVDDDGFCKWGDRKETEDE